MYPKERYDMVRKSVYWGFINTSKIYVQMINEGSSVKISKRKDSTQKLWIIWKPWKPAKDFSQKFYPGPSHREHRPRLLLPINWKAVSATLSLHSFFLQGLQNAAASLLSTRLNRKSWVDRFSSSVAWLEFSVCDFVDMLLGSLWATLSMVFKCQKIEDDEICIICKKCYYIINLRWKPS